MDRGKWEKILTCFQSSARGYLVRNEIRRARSDFEDFVKDIDGGLAHLEWRDGVIPTPHFTDTDGPFLRPRTKPTDPGPEVCAIVSSSSSSSSAAAAAAAAEKRGERTEAERDDSQPRKGQISISKDCFTHSTVRGTVEEQRGSTAREDGRVMESPGDSTTVWSSLELDMNFDQCHKGPRQRCLAQEVPCNPEALRLHRNTLTMELLWLQQAIVSRKKYLSLKDRLSIS